MTISMHPINPDPPPIGEPIAIGKAVKHDADNATGIIEGIFRKAYDGYKNKYPLYHQYLVRWDNGNLGIVDGNNLSLAY